MYMLYIIKTNNYVIFFTKSLKIYINNSNSQERVHNYTTKLNFEMKIMQKSLNIMLVSILFDSSFEQNTKMLPPSYRPLFIAFVINIFSILKLLVVSFSKLRVQFLV